MAETTLTEPVVESAAGDKSKEASARKLGVEAYIFGYPLVLMDVTRRVMTAVSKPGAGRAPVNQIGHLREFPDYTFTDVVSPNADTLYSASWIDVTKEPMVLSVPAAGKRYYLMPLLDGWTNVFASPGTRTTGEDRGDFAITGPRWTGTLPGGLREIKSPTGMVWMIGRTQTNGKADYDAVHKMQDQYKLTPLSAWGKAYQAPASVPVEQGVDMKVPPLEQVAKMDVTTFFNRLNALMKDNPPAAADAAAMARFAAIGVAPGKTFDLKSLDPAVARGLDGVALAGQEAIISAAKKPHGAKVNGWDSLPANTGKYGTDYAWRAAVALVGLGANVREDAMYPHTMTDAGGRPLSGKNHYVVRFRKGQLPPVNAFWSLTMYNAKQAFVQNPIHRYAIGDRDKLRADADGSVTIYIQHDSPGKDKESNWLPAPPDSFNVFLRLYWPTKEILDSTWKMPPVERTTP
jgi:hypothetical protein